LWVEGWGFERRAEEKANSKHVRVSGWRLKVSGWELCVEGIRGGGERWQVDGGEEKDEGVDGHHCHQLRHLLHRRRRQQQLQEVERAVRRHLQAKARSPQTSAAVEGRAKGGAGEYFRSAVWTQVGGRASGGEKDCLKR
jgi:hypothetical protein